MYIKKCVKDIYYLKLSAGQIFCHAIFHLRTRGCNSTHPNLNENYEDSLPRKRKHFCTEEERIERIKENAWRGGNKKKFHITQEELEKLVWELPATKIAEKYGVSSRLITKRCVQLGIDKPGRGYWAKLRSK